MLSESTFGHLAVRLDAALTADLIATRSPLVKADSDQLELIKDQMADTGFDVLPANDEVSSYWVRGHLLPGTLDERPVRRALQASDLVAAATPLLGLLRLMAEQKRAVYFVLRAARVDGLVTYADLNKAPMRTAIYTLVTEVEEVLVRAFEVEHSDADEWERWLAPPQLRAIERRWNEARD